MLGRSAVVSDTGRRRRHNEDQYVCVPPLFAVADGMGGAQAGEVASGLAAAVLNEAAGDERGEERVASLIQEANRRVFQRSSEDASTSGMGTTMTVALVDGDTIAFGHVGDSRAYRIRGDKLEQLTDDHSLVGELVRSGRLSPEEAESHPQRSVITRALGTEPDVDVDTFTIEAEPGDVYLICSDGLTDMVPPRELEALLVGKTDDLDAAARVLVDAANAGGGEDNITVVLFQFAANSPSSSEVTMESPVVTLPEPEPEADAEDTLSGLDPVPAVDTAVISADTVEEQLQQLEPEPEPAAGACAGGTGAAAPATRPADRARPRARGDRRPRVLGAHPLTSRNRELLNLIAVSLLTAIGFASVYIARSEDVNAVSLTYAGIFMALYLAAHLVARYTVPYADPVLLPLAALLSAIGVTVIYRLEPADAGRQSLWVVIGVVLFALTLIALRHDYRRVESYKYLFGISAILLLMLPALPGIGQTINGARLWVKVGSFQFQPGELAKIFLIIFLAGYLRDKREVLAQGRIKDFGPLLLIWGAAMLVLVQTNDLGSALLQFGIFLAMLYVATGRAAYALAGLGLFIAGSAFVYHFVGHVHERVTIWLHPWTDQPVYCASTGELALRQDCGSFQLVKSLYSIANGGFGGTGLGKGTFTTTAGDPIIPFLNTDFIYSAVAQELGLVGAAGLLLVFMLFVARGMRVALMADDGFSKLLAAGLTFGFALQTFIIVGGVLRVIPLTGITLPFVSYGGSSVVANFILLALLLLVSNRANAHAQGRA